MKSSSHWIRKITAAGYVLVMLVLAFLIVGSATMQVSARDGAEYYRGKPYHGKRYHRPPPRAYYHPAPVYVAPPPQVVYTPPPPPPGITFVFPINIR